MRKERFDTPKHVRLEISLAEGRVDVQASDTDETVVELSPAGRGTDRAREAIEDSRVEARDRGDHHEVVVHVDQSRGFGFRVRSTPIQITVSVPNGADATVNSASADVRGLGAFGKIEVNSASGDVYFEEAGGDVELKTASGDVNVPRAGSRVRVNTASGDIQLGTVAGAATVKSASGDVQIGEAGTELSVQTASGDTRVDAVTAGKVDLKSASGDMIVGVRRGSRLWVDAKTLSGDTQSELELGDDLADEEGPLVELRATAMSGDIRVVRA